MRGLIQKDICLSLQRKQTVIIFFLMALIMGAATDGTFVIGYLTMFSVLLTISTVSYDEFDNGYPFLMTLPITRKQFIQEKYLFCLMGGVFGWLVASVVYIAFGLGRHMAFSGEDIAGAVIFLPIFVLLASVLLPIQIKYGSERSRMVIAIFGGCIFVAAIIGKKLFGDTEIDFSFVDRMNMGTLQAVLWVIAIIVGIISYMLCVHIMEQKEF